MNRWSSSGLAAVIAAAAVLVCSFAPAMAAEEKPLPEGQVRTVIPVKGMDCAGCAKAVKLAVQKLDGVIDVTVDHEKGQATVIHKKDKPTIEQLVAAINGTGFRASPPKEG